MAWLATDKSGDESIYEECPYRTKFFFKSESDFIMLPKGAIKKLIGRDLTWEDEPVEI